MDLLTPDSPEHFQGSSPSPPKRLRLSTPEGVGNDRSAPIIVDGDSTTSVEPAPSQESAYEALSSGCQTPASNKESAQCTHLKEGSESLVLLTTFVNLEYGEDMKNHMTISLEFLVKHSPKLRELFNRAEDIIEQYDGLESLRRKTRQLLCIEKWEGKTRKNSHVEGANLILDCFTQLPLPEYQERVKHTIIRVTEEAFTKKSFWPADTPRITKAEYPRNAIRERLSCLEPEAAFYIITRLDRSWQNIEEAEKKNATKNALKAAAQRRVLLPEAEKSSLGSVYRWMHSQPLVFSDADHLLRIYSLAEELGLVALVEICTEKLYAATSAIIEETKAEGIGLREILSESITDGKLVEGSRGPLNNPLDTYTVVPTVMRFVFKAANNAPAKLEQLVVDIIVECGDHDLVEHEIIPGMNMKMRGQLSITLMRRNCGLNLEIQYLSSHIESSQAEPDPGISHHSAAREVDENI